MVRRAKMVGRSMLRHYPNDLAPGTSINPSMGVPTP